MFSLDGKAGLVVGVANEHSIAWGCARTFKAMGAELAVTYVSERTRPYVLPIATALGVELVMAMDVGSDAQVDGVFEAVEKRWGRLDFLLHSLATCPKPDLHGRVIDSSRAGFEVAMDVTCHSFVRLMRKAEPLMKAGGACLTVSYLGAERAVAHYGVMGPVKAALEAIVRYAAAELGPQGITVNALSPGPLRTRAASGISHIDELLRDAEARAPTHRLARLEDIGAFAGFLVSDGARNVTGGVHHIDGGYSVVG
jgi:enoyl-[acyl-carrier protein] reductase I